MNNFAELAIAIENVYGFPALRQKSSIVLGNIIGFPTSSQDLLKLRDGFGLGAGLNLRIIYAFISISLSHETSSLVVSVTQQLHYYANNKILIQSEKKFRAESKRFAFIAFLTFRHTHLQSLGSC